MLCQDCQKKEAIIHLTQITGNETTVLDLCADCAARRGFENPLANSPFPLGDFLASMVEKSLTKSTGSQQQLKCDKCGLTFAEFSKTGRFGCGGCYAAFHAPLDDLLRKIHGSNRHTGKLPWGSPDKMKPLLEERKLQEELRDAVKAENFELAAELRDRLKSLSTSGH
jgi:protein arginine kinase activator